MNPRITGMPEVLIASVSQLYQGDLDVGRVVLERLGDLGPDIRIEVLSYGAVAVGQRLEELRPGALVVVGAAERGRAPGFVERREVERIDQLPERAQAAIADAVTGYVGIDLLLDVTSALGALPRRTVVIEV